MRPHRSLARLAALAMCAATALFGHSAANAGSLMMDAPEFGTDVVDFVANDFSALTR
jgi:hypothetical protein